MNGENEIYITIVCLGGFEYPITRKVWDKLIRQLSKEQKYILWDEDFIDYDRNCFPIKEIRQIDS